MFGVESQRTAKGVATAAEVRELMHRLQASVWELTALALVLREDGTVSAGPRRDAERLLAELGLMSWTAEGGLPAAGLAELIKDGAPTLAAEASASVLQCSALLSGSSNWSDQDDEALLAQGKASAQAGPAMRQFMVPALEGLAELLEGPAPAMLDVGVEVAAMAVAICQVFPRLRVVGLDVSPRPLALARGVINAAGMADRIELREQDVAALADCEVFALGWIPAPFVPREALEAGLLRMVTALVPGGWLIVGHGKFRGDERENALNRFKTTVFGGTPLADEEAEALLRDVGLTQVWTLPTPEGAPGLTAGRRPPAA